MIAPWHRRALKGIGQLMWAAGASGLVAVLLYSSSPEEMRDAPPLPQLLALYFGIALVSGAIWGILRPLVSGLLAQSAVAALAAWPLAVALVVMVGDRGLMAITIGDHAIAFAIALWLGPVVVILINAFGRYAKGPPSDA